MPVWTTVRVFMVANLGRYVPGKIWQIAGLAYLAKREVFKRAWLPAPPF